jgi:hypothetical protein
MIPNILMPITIFMTKYFHNNIPFCRFNSVINLSKIFSPVVIAAFILFTSSCEEGPTLIGSKILPGGDFVTLGSTDTLSVFSYTRYDSTVQSGNASISYLGSIYDPYFGMTSADFVTQIRLGRRWEAEPYTVDSIKLFLGFLEVKGDVQSEQILKISEIAEFLHVDSTYYSNKPVLLTGYDVAEITLPELQADTINDIELNIPVEFGEYLLRDTSKLFHSNSVPDFRSYFKGLYFRISSSTGPLLLTLQLAPSSSAGYYSNYFVLYYHDELDVQKQYYFILDAVAGNARYNRFEHDFEVADPAKMINHINDGFRDTLSYLQALNGVYTTFSFPGLETIKQDPSFSGLAVNKAIFTFPIHYDNEIYKASTVPSQILLSYKTRDGLQYVVPDYYISKSFFGGALDSTNNIYKFNVAAFIQSYLEDASDNIVPELNMVLPSGATRNVILKANNTSDRVEFEFTYTKF